MPKVRFFIRITNCSQNDVKARRAEASKLLNDVNCMLNVAEAEIKVLVQSFFRIDVSVYLKPIHAEKIIKLQYT